MVHGRYSCNPREIGYSLAYESKRINHQKKIVQEREENPRQRTTLEREKKKEKDGFIDEPGVCFCVHPAGVDDCYSDIPLQVSDRRFRWSP